MSEHVRGTAFGLAIEADFAIPGLPPDADRAGLPAVLLTLADKAALERAWHRERGGTRISEERFGDAEPDRTIDSHPKLGYRLQARYFGSCLVARDGATLLCVPPPIPSWRWQRFLVGRCLPLAAVLRGYEVLHAGAVATDGGVVAIVGPSGAGKSSLTLHLVLRGAGFFTDDVLVLEAGDDLVAHPGFGVVNVRAAEDARLREGERAALGSRLGQTGRDKRHYALAPVRGPRPLRAVYFLAPGAGRPRATIAPLTAPEPRRLLTSAFIHEIRTPERLARLLDVCARLSAAVPMFEVALGAAEDAGALAGRLRTHARTRVLP
jgi:hypothetical protein